MPIGAPLLVAPTNVAPLKEPLGHRSPCNCSPSHMGPSTREAPGKKAHGNAACPVKPMLNKNL